MDSDERLGLANTLLQFASIYTDDLIRSWKFYAICDSFCPGKGVLNGTCLSRLTSQVF
jgi:hypothetical protein